METPRIFESEYRFCLLLWEHEPVNSTRLAALCRYTSVPEKEFDEGRMGGHVHHYCS